MNYNYIYYPVKSEVTGKNWLNNNLLANHSNAYSNSELDMFQQVKDQYNQNDYGGTHKVYKNIFDATNNLDNDLYVNFKKIKEINSQLNLDEICPIGWRIPTKNELEYELKNIDSTSDTLKFTTLRQECPLIN